MSIGKTLVKVEITKGSKLKYELDHHGRLVLDRIVRLPYPAAYGAIMDTQGPDGDPLDVFILNLPKGVPRDTLVKVRIIAKIEMTDGGIQDDKYLAMLERPLGTVFNTANAIIRIRKFLRLYKYGTVVGATLSAKCSQVAEWLAL